MIYSAAQYKFYLRLFLTLLARRCEGLPQPGHYIFQTLGSFSWRLLERLGFIHPSVDGDWGFIIGRRCWGRFGARHCCRTEYCKSTTL